MSAAPSPVRIVPVILSGGAGTRLWPLSRETAPKPSMPLPDGETLLAKTAARALALPAVAELVTVTNREYYFHTKDAYAGLRGKLPDRTSYLLEPFGRNTAPAVALAALWAERRYGADAVLVVLPADHLIRDHAAFVAAVARAARPRAERLAGDVRHRARPSGDRLRLHRMRRAARRRRPAGVHGGPLRREAAAGEGPAVRRRGQLPVELGHVLLHADGDPRRVRAPCAGGARRRAPRRTDCTKRRATPRCWRSTPRFSRSVPDISLDYAVMEKAAAEGGVAVVRGTFDWSDVGSWQAMADLTRAGCGRQSRPGRAGHDRDARHLRPRGRSRRRDRRHREPDHRRHARRRAGRASRSPAAREGRRRRAEGARPRVLPAAQDGGAAVGRLHGAARKRPASRSSASR